MLDLKRLRVLREVAERGSFSAAADSLYVSQSAISQQITALEAEVGSQLLLRLRTGPVLTDAGSLLVGHAEAAMARLEQAERDLDQLSGRGSGELRMISFPSASVTIVSRAARYFHERFPGVRLSLTEGDPEYSLPDLKRGDADLVLAYDFEIDSIGPDRDLILTHLLDEEMHVALPADHPLADEGCIRLDQLADENWLCGTGDGSCRRLTVGSCERAGFQPNVLYESDDYNVMQAFIASGMGVTLLPDLALLAKHPDVAIVDVAPEPPVRRIWAVTLGAGSRSNATEAMIEILAEASNEIELAVAAAAA
jgi:DNA-binding transcriptional LysR family regulator